MTSRPVRILVLAFGLLAASLLAGCGDDGGGESGSGQEIFRSNCASCHGTEGGGGLGKNLHGVADRLTRAEHIKIVTEGKGQMPTFGGDLSESEIEMVVDYERTLPAD